MSDQLTSTYARQLLPDRPVDAHKGSFGKVMVVAGSLHFPGAAWLAAAGAARSGAGLVTLAAGQAVRSLAARLPEPTHYCTVTIEQPKAPKQKKKTTTTSTSTTPNPPPPPNDDRPESPKPFTPPKQLKQHNNLDNDQLFIDCVDALRSLGLKKLASKQRAKEIFSSPNRPSNIQEFLLIAFKN